MDAGEDQGGAAYAHMIESTRRLQDLVIAASDIPTDVVESLRAELDAMNATLEKFDGPEAEQWSGRRLDLPARGNILLPPYLVDGETETGVYGRVTFTRLYLGGGAAAHGGTQPLLFDDVLGVLISRVRGDVPIRTGYLKVDYRKITPLDVELRFEARIARVDGRKTIATGQLLDDAGNVLCDAEALFLVLLPGQP